jgi:23S rRNA (cytidine2498-2'-O)-methyltransferase
MPDFLFVTCQIGAEGALKRELARREPVLRLAFSRPGFLTFKLPADHGLTDDFDLGSVFARAYGFSLGQVQVAGWVERSEPCPMSEKTLDGACCARPTLPYASIWDLAEGRTYQRVHVWQRDAQAPGERDFEPTLTPAAVEAHRLIVQRCPRPQCLAGTAADLLKPAKPGELILDCILVDPDRWWVGYHRAKSVPSRQPGGLFSIELPQDAASRAWLKTEEALRWARLPIPPGSQVAEIGSAPGGSSQCLLSHGFLVTGIDPAVMAPAVLENSHFTHIRRRSTQVRRRDFRKIRWLTVDMNVAPRYTLDAVEAIVTHPQINIRGLLLTLKLPQWEMAEEIPAYLDRIRGWGFNLVRARQLQYNRREICVAALQKPFRRK